MLLKSLLIETQTGSKVLKPQTLIADVRTDLCSLLKRVAIEIIGLGLYIICSEKLYLRLQSGPGSAP